MCKRSAFLESQMAKNGFWSKVLNTSSKMTDFKIPTDQFKLILTISSANEDEGSGSFCGQLWFSGLLPCMTLVTFQNSLTDTCWYDLSSFLYNTAELY